MYNFASYVARPFEGMAQGSGQPQVCLSADISNSKSPPPTMSACERTALSIDFPFSYRDLTYGFVVAPVAEITSGFVRLGKLMTTFSKKGEPTTYVAEGGFTG